MYIYAIQNKINGKLYIGQTVQNLEKYWNYNIQCALAGASYKPALYAALRKYGVNNFNFIHIGTTGSKESLNNWEKLAILVYGTKNKKLGYNLTDGGDGTVGAERTEEWKRNISKALTGTKFTPERSARASAIRKGKTLTNEHKIKIGKGVKGTKKPQKWINQLIERNKNRKGEKRKPRTAEHQAKLSESRRRNNILRKQLMEATNGANTTG